MNLTPVKLQVLAQSLEWTNKSSRVFTILFRNYLQTWFFVRSFLTELAFDCVIFLVQTASLFVGFRRPSRVDHSVLVLFMLLFVERGLLSTVGRSWRCWLLSTRSVWYISWPMNPLVGSLYIYMCVRLMLSFFHDIRLDLWAASVCLRSIRSP